MKHAGTDKTQRAPSGENEGATGTDALSRESAAEPVGDGVAATEPTADDEAAAGDAAAGDAATAGAAAGDAAFAYSRANYDAAAHGRRRGPRKAVVIAVVVAVVLLAAVYAGEVVAFAQVYYPGTTIMGVDVSLADQESAAADLSAATSGYALTVSTDDGFEWVYGDEDSEPIEVDTAELASAVMDQNEPLLWPYYLVRSLSGTTISAYSLDSTDSYPVEYDEEAFLTSLDAAIEEYNSTRSGTFDAASAYDEEQGILTVEAARANQQLDAEAVETLALAAMSALAESVELGDDAYTPLADGATDATLQSACDAVNTIIGVSFDLTLGGTVVYTFDGSQLLDSFTFDEGLTPSYDTSIVEDIVEELYTSLYTVGTERTFTGTAGDEVSVSGGTWGWEIDADALLEKMLAAIVEGDDDAIEIPTLSEADVFTAVGEPDWGAYIEVDIGEQHAWYYDADGTLLWDAGVITGNPNKGNDTPTGVYYVNAMYRNITLRGGYDADTDTYGWETPVSYWMAFVGSSVGFHDATWQATSYFSDSSAYLSHGSHGCVNLQLSAAEELYSLLEVGVCVIVHD